MVGGGYWLSRGQTEVREPWSGTGSGAPRSCGWKVRGRQQKAAFCRRCASHRAAAPLWPTNANLSTANSAARARRRHRAALARQHRAGGHKSYSTPREDAGLARSVGASGTAIGGTAARLNGTMLRTCITSFPNGMSSNVESAAPAPGRIRLPCLDRASHQN